MSCAPWCASWPMSGLRRAPPRSMPPSEFPWDLKELLAKQDLMGIAFPTRFGGTELDNIAQAIVVEEIARADATTSLIVMVQKLGALPIMVAGTEEQQARYFPRLASGEWMAAFGLTEASAGSDVAGIRMRASATATTTSSAAASASSPTARSPTWSRSSP